MKILLINQHSLLNRGDFAICLEGLRLAQRAFPQAEIGLTFHQIGPAQAELTGNPVYEAIDAWAHRYDQHGPGQRTPLPLRLLYLLLLAATALVYRLSGRIPAWFKDPRKQATLAAYAEADLILAAGGGYWYDSPYQGNLVRRLLVFMVWSIWIMVGTLMAIGMGKRLILLPQSIGPLRDPFWRLMIRWIVQHAELTLVRERESLALLEELGCSQRALYVPDLVFAMESAPVEEARAILAEVGVDQIDASFLVGITALDWGLQNQAFGGQAAYERALGQCIDAITAQGGAVVLFRQSIDPNPAWDDLWVSKRIQAAAQQRDRVLVIDRVFRPEVLQAAYGCMDYFIGTRMHSVIMASNAGTPALAIGYLYKSRGIMQELGLASYCFEIETVTGEQLIEGLQRLRTQALPSSVSVYLRRARRTKKAVEALLQIRAAAG